MNVPIASRFHFGHAGQRVTEPGPSLLPSTMPATDIEHFHRGVCACCGTDTAYTRGVVRNGPERVARYLVKWTVGDPSHGMGWLVSLPAASGGGDVVVSLSYSFEQNSFMVRHPGDV